MRVVIQRVSRASVRINGQQTASIEKGILILLGIEDVDNMDDVAWLCAKIAKLRIFPDVDGVMNLCINDVAGDVLIVSQFTLHAHTKKGNRPSYIRAAGAEHAIPLYESFIIDMKSQIKGAVKSGVFGASMMVELVNDGPVTLIIDTKKKE
jgi:D-aminoacyl-tRNA deacylase